VDEHDRILQHDFHPFGIGHEVRRQIAAVELHAFDDVERGVRALGFFDRDDAVFAHPVHCFGDDPPDGLIMVRRDGADLGDHRPGDGLGHLLERNRDRLDGLFDATLDFHGVRASGDVLRALAIDRLCQHRGRRSAIPGDVRRLARDFLHHVRAHVLERILQVDFLRDRHAVLGDRGRPEFLVEDDVAALGPERHLHGIREAIDPAQNRLARRIAVCNLVCHHELRK
jgi:hypothetical protein